MSRRLLPELAESLDAEELDELHDALYARNGEDGPLLDGLSGLVTALLVGPRPATSEEWLPLVLNPEEPFSSHLEAEHLTSLCLRLYHAVERGLEQLVYEPILSEYEDGDDDDDESDPEHPAGAAPEAGAAGPDPAAGGGDTVVDARGWCAGFSMGVDLRASLWEPRLRHDPRLMEIMAPIMALAFAEGLFEEYSDPRWPPLSEAEREACLQMIPSCVIDIQHYWRDHPPQLEPIAGERNRRVPRKRGGRWVH
jgi:uncharacterized protein